jgi:hypothetical protein
VRTSLHSRIEEWTDQRQAISARTTSCRDTSPVAADRLGRDLAIVCAAIIAGIIFG